jgi:hypothetical protein
MEALERELEIRRIEDIFDEIGDERLAHEGDLEEMAKVLADYRITGQL